MRWAGAMIADVHRVLCRGGVFLYPIDRKIRSKNQEGKLRLMYEANPMSLIVSQAGGLSTNAHQAILDIQPEGLHQRVAVVLGSSEEVTYVTDKHIATGMQA